MEVSAWSDAFVFAAAGEGTLVSPFVWQAIARAAFAALPKTLGLLW